MSDKPKFSAMKAHYQYLRYVLRHKWYVFNACLHYRILWRGIKHDWTKFLPVEWFPYVRFFYGDNSSREDYDPASGESPLDFEMAWNHHQKHNDHHWQYWIRLGDDGTTRLLPMPDKARREMVADWIGAGLALGKPRIWEWYEANKHKMQLHPDTRAWVEGQMVEIYGLWRDKCRAEMLGIAGVKFFGW